MSHLALNMLAVVLGGGGPPPVPVLVELYTSQGCSSCPPADEGLERLVQSGVPGARIIPLGFHVDYWNRLGWPDPFSSPAYSERQADFAKWAGQDGPYTPQVVVDGTNAFVWSDARVRKAIAAAATTPRATLELLTHASESSARIRATWKKANLASANGPVSLFLAITEDDLVTKVPRGENAGRTLHHTAVVRVLRALGTADDGIPVEAEVDLDRTWKRGDLHAVVFAQDANRRPLAAAQVALIP